MKQNNPVSVSFLLAFVLLQVGCSQPDQKKPGNGQSLASAASEFDRTGLPMLPPEIPLFTQEDARDTAAPALWDIKAPKGTPNVVLVMIDDFGFGMGSAFGGPINMPFADKLAESGIHYNRFRTTASCSPSRVALLTGRNHHSNNMVGITEVATPFTGNTGIRPLSIAQITMTLKLNGFMN